MKPEIFMDEFERNEDRDVIFGVVGRAFTFATRFEANCRKLLTLIGVKYENPAVITSEEDLKQLIIQLEKLNLNNVILKITRDSRPALTVLNRARIARNKIAHEFSIGLDAPLDRPFNGKELIEDLRVLCVDVAEGDRLICYVATLITRDYMPSQDFLNEYPELVAKWVCGY